MEARILKADELRVGLKVSYERQITEEDVLTFAQLSGDCNRLHVDSSYAGATNYQGRIVHGAFQVALASAVLGMHLPGGNVLLGSIYSRFPAPLYFPTHVRLIGEIASWNRETLAGQLKVLIQELSSYRSTAEVSLGFTLHEYGRSRSQASTSVKNEAIPESEAKRDLVIVTGASGGLGSVIVSALANEYRVIAVNNRHSIDGQLSSLPNVSGSTIDLTAPDAEVRLESAISKGVLFGLIHAAWPGAPRGSLLHADDNAIKSQVEFGTAVTVRLSRFLFNHVGEKGGRFIALGSTAGSFRPELPMGAYSLAKACLENTVRLLAPELARKQITINAACPSFVPVGINKEADQRKQMHAAAAIPWGRLCEPGDVVGIVEYLLSPQSEFISGQILALTGGQV